MEDQEMKTDTTDAIPAVPPPPPGSAVELAIAINVARRKHPQEAIKLLKDRGWRLGEDGFRWQSPYIDRVFDLKEALKQERRRSTNALLNDLLGKDWIHLLPNKQIAENE